MKKGVLPAVIMIITLACSPNKSEQTTVNQFPIDTLQEVGFESDNIDHLEKSLSHENHSADKSYPWFDTRYVGNWIKEAYLDSLIKIFRTDTTISLYGYTSRFHQCDGELLTIEIEGCIKENSLYFKNSGCNNRYVSKSNFTVDFNETSFTLEDFYSGNTYLIESPKYQELKINGVKFAQTVIYLSDIIATLDGIYIVYDSKNVFADTLEYRSGNFNKSNSFSEMNLNTNFLNEKISYELPSLPNSDLVSVEFYTGNMVDAELIDDAGNGTDSYETIPETETIRFDIIRTSEGFELHNAFNIMENRLLSEGLVWKFKRIEYFNSKRRKLRQYSN